jgi:hypothetical protein
VLRAFRHFVISDVYMLSVLFVTFEFISPFRLVNESGFVENPYNHVQEAFVKIMETFISEDSSPQTLTI